MDRLRQRDARRAQINRFENFDNGELVEATVVISELHTPTKNEKRVRRRVATGHLHFTRSSSGLLLVGIAGMLFAPMVHRIPPRR